MLSSAPGSVRLGDHPNDRVSGSKQPCRIGTANAAVPAKTRRDRRGRDYLSHSPCFISLRILRLIMSRLMKLR